MKFYELTYLISPELSEKDCQDFSQKINSLIQTEGGVLNETNLPFKKTLAYPIKKKREAFLTSLEFYLEPEKIKDLEKKIKSEEKILRYLILTKKISRKIPIPKAKKIKPKKVELKEIEKKLEEILGE